MKWRTRNAGPIGIDFGARAIRMVQVTGPGSKPVICAAAEFEYPFEADDPSGGGGVPVSDVRQMLSSSGFTGRSAVTALSDHDVQIRNLRLPDMPQEELAEAVRFEAAERFDFHDSQAEYRYIPVGPARGGGKTQLELAVFGAPGAAIRRHLELVSELGLVAEAIDVAHCAVFRPFERFLRRGEDVDQVNAFVDLGYRDARIAIARGQELIFLKSIGVGGQRFDELVAECLSVDLSEARRMRRAMVTDAAESVERPDSAPPATQSQVRSAIRPAVEKLGKEIGLCLRYCAVTFRGPRCDSVTCVGGEALDCELLDELSAIIGVPARKGHPLRGATGKGVFTDAQQRTGQPQWATAFGLALKPIASAAGRVA